MITCANILRGIGLLIVFAGIVIGGIQVIDSFSRGAYAVNLIPGLTLLAGSVISGTFLYGIGFAFLFLVDIAIDARLAREANERATLALERLANRQPRQHPEGQKAE